MSYFNILPLIFLFLFCGCAMEKGMVVDPVFAEKISNNNTLNGSLKVIPEIVISHSYTFQPSYQDWRFNISYSDVGPFWSTNMRSIMVLSGTWAFYQLPDFKGEKVVLQPGYYPKEQTLNSLGGTIGSFQIVF